MNLTRILFALTLGLGAVLSPGVTARAGPEATASGLAGYRTVGARYNYVPVVLRPAAAKAVTLTENGQVASVRCRAIHWVKPTGGLREGAFERTAKSTEFRISRPQTPRSLGARFDIDLRRALAADYCVIMGLRPVKEDDPYRPIVSRKSGSFGLLAHPVSESEIGQWLRSLAVYARLGASKSVGSALWKDILSIPVAEVRFVALRDILFASYHRGLNRKAVAIRVDLLHEVGLAMGQDLTPERWLRLHLAVEGWDPNGDVLTESLGNAEALIGAAASKNRPLSLSALAIAARHSKTPHVRAVAVRVLGAFLSRGPGLSDEELGLSARVAEAIPSSATGADEDARRSVLKGLDRLVREAAGSKPSDRFWGLVLALSRRMPKLTERVADQVDGSLIREALVRAVASSRPSETVFELERLWLGSK